MKYVLLSLLLFAGCTTNHFTGESCTPAQIKDKSVIIFVPGLYGSALTNTTTGDRIFLTLGQALWGSPLALEGIKLSIPGTFDLKPTGMMDSVPVIPGLYGADVYGGSFRFFEKAFGKSDCVLSVGYDWRQEDSFSVQIVAAKVREVRKLGAKRVALVGPSLGALLTSYYLRYGDQRSDEAKENWEGSKTIDAAILAAPPFRGALAVFKDFLRGTSAGLAKEPLSAISVGSFPSFYQFLPPQDSGEYVDSEKASVGKRIFEVEEWKKWKAGLFNDGSFSKEREEYTKAGLKMSQNLSALTLAPPNVSNSRVIPVLVLIATGEATPSQAILSKDGTWSFEEKGEGDGLVSVKSASPPEALMKNLNVEEATFSMPHRGMFTRQPLQERVTKFLGSQGF